MFKTEKIFLILLIGICLIISIVLLDSVMDPALLMRTSSPIQVPLPRVRAILPK